MDEVISLHDDIFVNIHNKEMDVLKSAFVNYEKNVDEFFVTDTNIDICQGDIIDKINFCLIDKTGKLMPYRTKGMIISSTCDLYNHKFIVVAPVYDFDRWQELNEKINLNQFKKNKYYQFFFIPNLDNIPSLLVDFNRVNSYQREYLNEIIQNKKAKRILSLTKKGHYLFNLKLLINLLRSESSNLKRS
ncbi:MAG: hypothetical protein MUP64_10445 [Anaerolineae bacterium]|nr:hypothetical protein [Anaerolineae bacterium]